MTNIKRLAVVAGVCVLFVGLYFGIDTFMPKEEIKDPAIEQTKPVDKPEIDIKIEGTPITQVQPKPTVDIKTDVNGNQEITPIVPPAPAPAPVVTPEPVTPKPEVKPQPTPQPKPEPKPETPVAKPKPETPKPVKPAEPVDGTRRVHNGQNQIYIDGFGWLEDAPGGESEYVSGMGEGEVIGH